MGRPGSAGRTSLHAVFCAMAVWIEERRSSRRLLPLDQTPLLREVVVLDIARVDRDHHVGLGRAQATDFSWT
ncbi:MAG: hypothetical protein U0527_08600 [Candidatus Eisenbacteria bacterium]